MLLGNGDGTFSSGAMFAVGGTPKMAATGDLNADGKVDLVTADQNSHTVSVLIGNGVGGFASAVPYAVCSGTHEVAVADLNGDGRRDLAVACWGDTELDVLLGNGDGTFGVVASYPSGAGPHSVTAGDFDGDGDQDLAAANRGASSVSILRGVGNGTFSPAVSYGAGSRPHSIRSADLNADGVLDLASANDGSDNVSVLIGNGNGTFRTSVSYPTGLVPKGIGIGDVNGDGKPDLLTTNTAGSYPDCCHPGDNTVSVLLGAGNGTFGSAASYTVGVAPFSVALGDFDTDDDLDLATANWHSGDVTVLANLSDDGPLPAGFVETEVITGLSDPTAIQFAADGRLFVAEKGGIVKVFDSLSDTVPDTFVDLRTNVHNFWDRGLLGLALHPAFPTTPYVYVLYTYDHQLGDAAAAPRWGSPGVTSDGCPNPPGATGDGCVVSARVSRLTASGNQASGAETVLVEDWCQQYPSHSIGTVMFGADGALYVGAGDGASFSFTDWGQRGSPQLNPCGDPPGGVGGTMTSPTAEGGALRSQDLRTRETGASYAAVLGALAPAAYWRLGEAAGSVASDSVGSSHGTYTNGAVLGVPGLLTGDPDRAVGLDGTNDNVSVPSSSALKPTTAMSVVAWIKPDAWNTYRRVLQKETGETSYMLRATTNAARLEFRIAGVGQAWTTTLPAIGARHLVVGTYGGGRIRLYIDGQLVSDRGASGTIPSAAGPLSIGGKPGSTTSGDFFDGVIDEVSIHHTSLSASAVADLWEAGSTTPVTDPVTLDGAILRLDPLTGAALPDNPLAGDPDPNARRIVGHGLRNPFRFTVRPGTNEIWIGDVGAGGWEEINRLTSPADASPENFGWPCYEGVPTQAGFDDFDLCEDLYAEQPSAVTAPYFAYRHDESVVSGDGCEVGSSSLSGLAFYSGGSYPSSYEGGLFFADYSRRCIWFAPAGANGLPDFDERRLFVGGASNPVQLTIGPGGDLFYADLDGSIRRISFSDGNQSPSAVATATPSSGPAPLDVQFDGSGSSDPEGGPITYAWDLDGDGAFDDSTAAAPTWTYPTPGNVTVSLRVTDPEDATGTDSVVVTAGNTAPTATIDTPTAGTTWGVDDTITFSGHASDPQDGDLSASQLSWSLILHHCPSNCHQHPVQSFPGVASGGFTAPDHEYPSHLELRLTATDSGGLTHAVSIHLDPETVVLSFLSNPAGLSLVVNGSAGVAPFNRTVISGSTNTVSATSPQSVGGQTYAFAAWSDGGAQTHTLTAPSTPASYTATYVAGSPIIFSDGFESGNLSQWNSATNVTVGTSEVFSGSFGARATSTGTPAWAWTNLSEERTDIYTRVRFKVISQGASNPAYLLRLRSATGTLLVSLYRNTDGRLRLKNDIGGPGFNSGVVVTLGVWHELQLHAVVHPSAGQTQVWLDGALVSALSGTLPLGSTPIGRLQIGESISERTFDIAFDDVVASRALIGP